MTALVRHRAKIGLDANYFQKEMEELAQPTAISAEVPNPPTYTRAGSLGRIIILIMEGEEKGLDYFYDYLYDCVKRICIDVDYCRMAGALYFQTDLRSAARILAHAVVLGAWNEAEQIAEAIQYGLSNRRIEGRNRVERGKTVCLIQSYGDSYIVPFVLNLYAQWSGRHFSLEGLDDVSTSLGKYKSLLALWQTEDLQALEAAILTACDFHMERSKASEDEMDYDFTTFEDILYPVEILAVLRLRENRGLPNPGVDHPLLNTPLGQLHEIKQVPYDEVMERAVANYIESRRLWAAQYKAGKQPK